MTVEHDHRIRIELPGALDAKAYAELRAHARALPAEKRAELGEGAESVEAEPC